MSLFDCQTSSEISNLKFEISYPTKRRNFNPQTNQQCHRLTLHCRSLRVQEPTSVLISNPKLAIRNSQLAGGGEGIRTPDPRVANAVLCQLSYAPDSLPIANFRLPIDRR